MDFMSFRPLAGIMVLINSPYLYLDKCILYCFRPLAGIMVLIAGLSSDDQDIRKVMFPSPCGDYGSYQELRHD